MTQATVYRNRQREAKARIDARRTARNAKAFESTLTGTLICEWPTCSNVGQLRGLRLSDGSRTDVVVCETHRHAL